MPKFDLMVEAALIILEEGCGLVRTVRVGPFKVAQFQAGTVPLNGEAVADLINAGWLTAHGPRDYFMATLPPFIPACGRASYGGTA